MPFKDPEKRKQYTKEYGAEWYKRNAAQVKARTHERNQKQRRILKRIADEYIENSPCADCGITKEESILPVQLDYYYDEGVPRVWEVIAKAVSVKTLQEFLDNDVDIVCLACARERDKAKSIVELLEWWKNEGA